MDPQRGYNKAKQLLKERFGNEHKLAVTYMDKALNWAPIKPEDGEALNSYSLFLTGCCNAMTDLSYLEEMNSATNMRAIVTKLPYKLREKWRTVACDIQDQQDRKVNFKDLVKSTRSLKFINKPKLPCIQFSVT